jgi:hypothetical protein
VTVRIAEAEREGWTGEAEGLRVSLTTANAKLAQLGNLIAHRTTAVHLGMPGFPDVVGRHITTGPRLPVSEPDGRVRP